MRPFKPDGGVSDESVHIVGNKSQIFDSSKYMDRSGTIYYEKLPFETQILVEYLAVLDYCFIMDDASTAGILSPDKALETDAPSYRPDRRPLQQWYGRCRLGRRRVEEYAGGVEDEDWELGHWFRVLSGEEDRY